MSAVWLLILELAEFERLSHAVTGSEESLCAGLGKAFECYVAIHSDQIIGYMICFTTYSTFRTATGTWLEDIYVSP